jgi:hypothetical protein
VSRVAVTSDTAVVVLDTASARDFLGRFVRLP